MKYSFDTIASRAIVTALFATVVSIGSAMPASASESVHPITELLRELM